MKSWRGLFLVVILTLSAACSSRSPEPGTAPAGVSSAGVAPAPLDPNLPNAARVASKNAGYPKADIPDWGRIAKAVTFPDPATGDTVLVLSTADFKAADLTEYLQLSALEKGQGMLEFRLNRQPAGAAPGAADAGEYAFRKPAGQAERTGSATVVLAGGVILRLLNPSGSFKVTSAGPDGLSGAFDLTDGWTTVTGHFRTGMK